MDERPIGEVLRELREQRRETQREVGADPAVGMDATLLSHIERGRRLPSPRQLEALAAHYEVPAEDLLPHLESSLRVRARQRWGRRTAALVESGDGMSDPSERRREWAQKAAHFFSGSGGELDVPTQYEASAAERAIDTLAATGATAIAGLQRLADDADPRVSERARRALALLRR